MLFSLLVVLVVFIVIKLLVWVLLNLTMSIMVIVSDGWLMSVCLVNLDGKWVIGMMFVDGMLWYSMEVLGYVKIYMLLVIAVNSVGQSTK